MPSNGKSSDLQEAVANLRKNSLQIKLSENNTAI